MKIHRQTATHPVTLAGGRMVGPGEDIEDLDLTEPHNAELVEAGSLTETSDSRKVDDLKGLKRAELEGIAIALGLAEEDVKALSNVDAVKTAIRDARENPKTPEASPPDEGENQ